MALLGGIAPPLPLIAERGYHADLDGAPRVTRPVAVPSLGGVLSPTGAGTRFVGLSHFGRPGMKARPALMEQALRRLRVLWPAARRRAGAAIWSGQRPATPDSLPIVESVASLPSLFVTTGHGHLGLTLAAVTGIAVAEMACGVPSAFQRDLNSKRFTPGAGRDLER